MRRLPWWWWAYGVVLAVNGFWDWPTTFGGWVGLVAEVVIIVGGLSTAIAWAVPTTRPRVIASWRWLRSLPSRFPWRVVRKSRLDTLRAQVPPIDLRPLLTGGSVQEPLSLPKRAERLLSEITAAMGKWDNTMSSHEKAQAIGFFQPLYVASVDLFREMRQKGYPPPSFEAGSLLIDTDPRVYEDPRRTDMQAISAYFGGIQWKDDEG